MEQIKEMIEEICLKYCNDNSIEKQKRIKIILKRKIYNFKMRDKKRNIINDLNFEDLCELLINNKNECYYCKCKMILDSKKYNSNRLTFDNMIWNIGHKRYNLCLCCNLCNSIKNTLDFNDMKFYKKFINERLFLNFKHYNDNRVIFIDNCVKYISNNNIELDDIIILNQK